mmetsp:Transcript_5342/g.11825  ORF Transcript_5342/g.11825 Transcript_5342/m.11825 type:complete len:95 (-) Transcript_5342:161-445(-)
MRPQSASWSDCRRAHSRDFDFAERVCVLFSSGRCHPQVTTSQLGCNCFATPYDERYSLSSQLWEQRRHQLAMLMGSTEWAQGGRALRACDIESQ